MKFMAALTLAAWSDAFRLVGMRSLADVAQEGAYALIGRKY